MIFSDSKAVLLRNRGKIGHFVENMEWIFICFNQMLKVFHRTHGGDALLKKTLKKLLTL